MTVTVSGYRAGAAIDRRDAIVQQVPTDRVAALTVVLSARCTSRVTTEGGAARSLCADAETCDPRSGNCVSAVVDGRSLPTYAPGDELDASVAPVADATVVEDAGAEAAPDVVTDGALPGCGATEKSCGGQCVSRLDPAYGCDDAKTCAPCSVDDKAITSCVAGKCALAGCTAGYKVCGGKCVAIDDPTYGCTTTSCDASACPDAGGTVVCSGGACVIGVCGSGTKACSGKCVPKDRNNGCESAGCTACTTTEVCQGSPSVCTCTPDNLTPCIGVPCGTKPNNCGGTADCADSCKSPLTCGGGDAGANGCGCTSNAVAVTCSGIACGPVQDNCGRTVVCPNTCPSGRLCGVGGQNVCGVAPSCALGLSPTSCGSGSDDCCASLLVPGGTFTRNADTNAIGTALATVSAFRLDKYEVTVGRFTAYTWAAGTYAPPPGSGMHVHLGPGGLNGSETGWTYPANTARHTPQEWGTLMNGCTDSTWGAGQSLPANCVTYTEALAFCIWDGGFLPTSVEWNYAATGGDAQRLYPWGSAAVDAQHAVFCGGGAPCPLPLTPGSRPMGVGRWGHLDLVGNVAEMTLDHSVPLINPCVDCASDTGPSVLFTDFRGGSYIDQIPAGPNALNAVAFSGLAPDVRKGYAGFRCARIP